MQNESRIVELLAEMLIKQDIFFDELRNVKGELIGVNQRLASLEQGQNRHEAILREHTGLLTRMSTYYNVMML